MIKQTGVEIASDHTRFYAIYKFGIRGIYRPFKLVGIIPFLRYNIKFTQPRLTSHEQSLHYITTIYDNDFINFL